MALSTAATEAPLLAPAKANSADVAQPVATRPLRDRRLIILFFDLSSMQPDESIGPPRGAELREQADGGSGSHRRRLAGRFAVRESGLHFRPGLLRKALQDFNLGAGEDFDEGSTGTTEGTAETGGSFTVDDTEYNIFNTDRRLQALRSIADKLSRIDEKKSLIYFL